MRGISKSYGGVAASRGLDFDVAGGEVVGLVGQNGADAIGDGEYLFEPVTDVDDRDAARAQAVDDVEQPVQQFVRLVGRTATGGSGEARTLEECAQRIPLAGRRSGGSAIASAGSFHRALRMSAYNARSTFAPESTTPTRAPAGASLRAAASAAAPAPSAMLWVSEK